MDLVPGLVVNSISTQLGIGRKLASQGYKLRDVQSLVVEMFRKHVRVKRSYVVRGDGMGTVAKRGEIRVFSPKSLSRLKFVADEVSDKFFAMITLTYPSIWPSNGQVVKRHWNAFRTWLVRKHNVCGLWFLEFQERGAPHFHVFISARVPYQEVAEVWYRIVASGDERHLRAGTRVEMLRERHAAGAYAVKYAEKMVQKNVPDQFQNVGRFWGLFGGLKCEPTAVVEGVKETVAPVARFVRRAYEASRRALGRSRWRCGGVFSFTAYGVAPALYQYIESGCVPRRLVTMLC